MQTTVKDLWILRLEKLASRLEVPDPEAVETAPDTLHPPEVGAIDPELGTQQSTADVPERTEAQETLRSFPRLVETISLCYLGILLLRLDTSLGDIHR